MHYGNQKARIKMKVTIDNSIRILEDYKRWRKKYGIFGSEEDDAINKLLEVAKKYQKIEQIIRSYDVAWEFHHMKPTIDKIREVMEDGKIDRC